MFSLGIVERLSKEVEGKRATVNIGTTNTYRKADQHGHKFVMMKKTKEKDKDVGDAYDDKTTSTQIKCCRPYLEDDDVMIN